MEQQKKQKKGGVLKKLEEMLMKYSMICYAYCLMDNHYHLFIKMTQPNLSQGIHYINSVYTNWFRNKHQIIGPIFQGRFKSILVDADHYPLSLYSFKSLASRNRQTIRRLPPEQLFRLSSFKKI